MALPVPAMISVARRIATAMLPAFVLALTVAHVGSLPAMAQDVQLTRIGRGFVNNATGAECVQPGANTTLESVRTNDDVQTAGSIFTGPDGICDTAAVGDDVQKIPVGQGLANAKLIVGDVPGANDDGICNDVIVAQRRCHSGINALALCSVNSECPGSSCTGDDVVRIPPGQSEPNMVEILPFTNGMIDSTPSGDDLLTAVICPEPDTLLQSTTSGDDEVSVISVLCDICTGSQACIIPGADGILQSAVNGSDTARPYISTGPNGIAQSTASGDDQQIIAIGKGFPGTACVSTGPDGIAQTTVCGNGIDDPDENAIPGTECDDGGETNGDGCSSLCLVESGWSCAGSPSTCTPVCGDGVVVDGELCDDGNSRNDDDCVFGCQPASCGDGFVHKHGTAPFEDCEPPNTATCDATCHTIIPPGCGDGLVNQPGEECDDGNSSNSDDCTTFCKFPVCGDGFVHTSGTPPFEQCEPPGTVTCDASCQALPFCGDGIVNQVGEECDDGNNLNDDACTVGCKNAFCGDGYKYKGVEDCEPPNTATCDATCHEIKPPRCGNKVIDPGEDCDDGNNSNRDDCTNLCKFATCGDGFTHTKGTGPFEECDDGNTAPGDGCSATCQLECGNGEIDGGCSLGAVGQPCDSDDDCDTSPGAGDGACVHEACDPGLANLCGMSGCSDHCQIKTCGNGIVECDEECDLGSENGPGSGCNVGTCTRNVVGKSELTGKGECPNAWTLDLPPGDLKKRVQVCTDGQACDLDLPPTAGQCTFHVGVCLNRPNALGCTLGDVQTFEILRPKVPAQNPAIERDAINALIGAVEPLGAGSSVPQRCRQGVRGKICSEDQECDTHLGAGNGICDIATGVLFDPALDPGDQTTVCTTPSVAIVVPAGGKLKLLSRVTRVSGTQDKDAVLLVCRP